MSRMPQTVWSLLLFGAGLLINAKAFGDVVFYRLPTSRPMVVMLEGTTTVNPGGTVTFSHSRYGRIYLDLESVDIKKAPTLEAQFARQLGKAGKDADRRMAAAQWALRHGMVPQFYTAIDKVLEADPNHARAVLVKKLKEQLEKPIVDSSKQIAEMKALVGRTDMKV